MSVCPKCGGNRTPERCNLCELFASGLPPEGTPTTGWPMVSDALGCHPDQVTEMNERAKKHNIGVKYDQKGFAHIPDRGEYRKILKLEKMFNKNSFTGY